jgi:hypothetical protein
MMNVLINAVFKIDQAVRWILMDGLDGKLITKFAVAAIRVSYIVYS